MFDNLQVSKGYKLIDNITGNSIEVCTFNATLTKGSCIYQNLNISYPKLYEAHKSDILVAYRDFEAEITALAITMGLAEHSKGASTLEELSGIREDLKTMAHGVMNEVIESLGNITVNPVPIVDVAHDYYNQYR